MTSRYRAPGWKKRRERRADRWLRRRVLHPCFGRYETELMVMFKQPEAQPGPSQELPW